MVVEPFQIIASTLFLSLIGILLWRTRCVNCSTLGFADSEEVFEEMQDAEYKIFRCKTCGSEKITCNISRTHLQLHPSRMITVSIGHSPVVGNQDLSGGDLRKKMTRSRCRNIGDQELAIIKFLLYSRTALTKRKGMSGMNGWKTYTDKRSKCQQTLQLGRKGG